MAAVLIIEDSPLFQTLMVTVLTEAGYETDVAADGEDGVRRAREGSPDVIILDLGLPKLDGIEVCRSIRTFSDAFILMLTARDNESDKIIGLSVGADDYMTKPFSPRELVARVQALLRRRRAGDAEPAAPTSGRQIGDLVIDTEAREVRAGGRTVELTRIEFDLLETLAATPRAVLTRAQLLRAVWGEDWYGDERLVDVHISKLRRKLGDQGAGHSYIRTVRGVGFGLAAASIDAAPAHAPR